MKLDIGGGRPPGLRNNHWDFMHTPPGWVAINRFPVYNPDIIGCVCDIPLTENAAKCARLFHFPYQWLDSGSIRELYRVLKPMGLLIIETGRNIEKNETFMFHLNKLFDYRCVGRGVFVGFSRKQ